MIAILTSTVLLPKLMVVTTPYCIITAPMPTSIAPATGCCISTFAGARAEQLSGAVKDSPMTDKKTEYSGMVGATYNF